MSTLRYGETAMAQLDKFILATVQQGASELHLVADREPRVLLEGRESVLTTKRPTSSQVRHLASEVAPDEVREALSSSDSAHFSYALAGAPPMRIEVLDWRGQTALLVRLGVAGEHARPLESRTSSTDEDDVLRPVPDPRDRHAIDAVLRLLVRTGSSDLHMSSKEVPMIRKDGEMLRINSPVLGPDDLMRMLQPIVPERNREEFERDSDTDFAYAIEGLARFRANMFRDRHGVGAVFRTIPADILTAEQLGLSEAIQNLSRLSKGLVLVTGPTGSGKSTTLCALIDLINRTRSAHIITIEDPIEFVHENKLCLINQREVGVHTQGFKRALRAALREDPDIVLVGEMRDLETIAIAIETAETGHLVFGTLHTSTAYSTIDRIIDQFPPDQQEQIRVMLSESLRGVVSQTLCKKVGGGRVAALEVLLSTPAVANLIREGKTFQIPSIMQTNRKMGMVLLNEALTDLVKAGKVDADEALLKAVDKQTLRTMLRSAGINVT